MPNKTLVLHLIRCPDRPPNAKICSFNRSHIMPKEEIEAHEKNCPNRLPFDNMLYTPINVIRPNIVIQNQPVIDSLEGEESWDDPEPVTRSVIKTINERSNLMKPICGLTKSKRKAYRNELATKYSNVDISYNENSSITARQDASTSASKGGEGEKQYQEKEKKQLFFGKRPN